MTCDHCHQGTLFDRTYHFGAIQPISGCIICGHIVFRHFVPVQDIPANTFWSSEEARIKNRDAARANGKLCKNGRRVAA